MSPVQIDSIQLRQADCAKPIVVRQLFDYVIFIVLLKHVFKMQQRTNTLLLSYSTARFQ